jgi:hypothetical protein
VGIGIQKTNAGIGIPASVISVRYRAKKMPDCAALIRYRKSSDIVRLFQSGTGLSGCWTIRHSGSPFFNFEKLTLIITAQEFKAFFAKMKINPGWLKQNIF